MQGQPQRKSKSKPEILKHGGNGGNGGKNLRKNLRISGGVRSSGHFRVPERLWIDADTATYTLNSSDFSSGFFLRFLRVSGFLVLTLILSAVRPFIFPQALKPPRETSYSSRTERVVQLKRSERILSPEPHSAPTGVAIERSRPSLSQTRKAAAPKAAAMA